MTFIPLYLKSKTSVLENYQNVVKQNDNILMFRKYLLMYRKVMETRLMEIGRETSSNCWKECFGVFLNVIKWLLSCLRAQL